MNQAAFDLASRKTLCQAVGKQRFIKMEREQKKEIISEKCIVSGKVTLRKEREGACQVGYLAGADQINCRLTCERLRLQLG